MDPVSESTNKLGMQGVTGKWYRSKKDRWISGVIGGLAKKLGMDSNLLRIIAIVIGNGGGAGIVAYGLLSYYLPEDPTETGKPESKFSFWKLLLILILTPIALVVIWFVSIFIIASLTPIK